VRAGAHSPAIVRLVPAPISTTSGDEGSSERTRRSRCNSRERPRRPDFGESGAEETVSNHGFHQRSSSSIQPTAGSSPDP
jgi:hypothetical protein